jgi:serine/threonine protein kinase
MESRTLGHYRLEQQIGEGGMGAVFRAFDTRLNRPVAVKMMHAPDRSERRLKGFLREARAASALNHPNIVIIHEVGETDAGEFFLVQELIDGDTLRALLKLRREPTPLDTIVDVGMQIARALSAAHLAGVVHRDVKPENVMMCRYGGAYDFVKILDFGLVKSVGTKHSRDLTRNLRILGTPLYMAPERLRNPADVDARADIYAVGALAYLMLTGRNMFDAADDLEMTSRILNEEPARVSAVAPQAVPMELDLVITACVEKRREDRPQRIADLVEAFEALASDFPWTQREAQAWWNNLPERELA